MAVCGEVVVLFRAQRNKGKVQFHFLEVIRVVRIRGEKEGDRREDCERRGVPMKALDLFEFLQGEFFSKIADNNTNVGFQTSKQPILFRCLIFR